MQALFIRDNGSLTNPSIDLSGWESKPSKTKRRLDRLIVVVVSMMQLFYLASPIISPFARRLISLLAYTPDCVHLAL